MADPWHARLDFRRPAAAAVLVAALVAGSGCASMAPRANAGHAAFLAASAGDVLSTRRALDAGATELNPLIGSNPNTAKLVAFKVAGWGALRGLENAVESELGRKMKWWEQALFWAIPTGISAWAAQHNMGVADRLER